MRQSPRTLLVHIIDDRSAHWSCEALGRSGVIDLDKQTDLTLSHRYSEIMIFFPSDWVQAVEIQLPSHLTLPLKLNAALSWAALCLQEQHHVAAMDAYWDVRIDDRSTQWPVWFVPKSQLAPWLLASKKWGRLKKLTASSLPVEINLLPWRQQAIKQGIKRAGLVVSIIACSIVFLALITCMAQWGGLGRWSDKINHVKPKLAKAQSILTRKQTDLNQLILKQNFDQNARAQWQNLSLWWSYLSEINQKDVAIQDLDITPSSWNIQASYRSLSGLKTWLDALKKGNGVRSVTLQETYSNAHYALAKIVLTFKSEENNGLA